MTEEKQSIGEFFDRRINPIRKYVIIVYILAILLLVFSLLMCSSSISIAYDICIALSAGILTGLTFYVFTTIKQAQIKRSDLVVKGYKNAIMIYEEIQEIFVKIDQEHGGNKLSNKDRVSYSLQYTNLAIKFLDNCLLTTLPLQKISKKVSQDLVKICEDINEYIKNFTEIRNSIITTRTIPDEVFEHIIELIVGIQVYYIYLKETHFKIIGKVSVHYFDMV